MAETSDALKSPAGNVFNCEVNMCPKGKPDGVPHCCVKYCETPVHHTSQVPVQDSVVGVAAGCSVLVVVIVALLFGYKRWNRAKSREKTENITMINNGQQENGFLKPPDLEPDMLQLNIIGEADTGNSGGSQNLRFHLPQLMQELTQHDMWIISEYLANKKWVRVGRNVMVANDRLEEIDSSCKNDYRECAYQMLVIWRESNPKCTLQDLFIALKELRWESTIEQIIRHFSKRNSEGSQYLRSQFMATPLPICQWADRDEYLENDIENGHRALQMPRTLRESNPILTPQDHLIAALDLALESSLLHVKDCLIESISDMMEM